MNFDTRKCMILASGVLAVGTCISTAHADQSNVTIYGIVDSGIGYTTNASKASDGGNRSAVSMVTGGETNNRLGFKGAEDLGGGLKTVFQLESGISTINGSLQQGGRMFGRMALVGIEAPFGAITLGRQKIPIYDFFLPLDPLDYSNWSLTAYDTQFVGRADNSVKYMGHAGPLTLDVLYSTGYDATLVNSTQDPFRVGQEIGSGISYDSGPVYAALAYDMRRGTTADTQDNKEQRVVLGASYRVTSSIKAYAGYRWFNSSVPSTAGRSDMYWGGVQMHVTSPLVLTAAVYYTDIKSARQRPIAFDLQSKYYFSKRTSVYAQVSYIKNSNGSNLGVAGYGSSIVAGSNQTGVEIGINHVF